MNDIVYVFGIWLVLVIWQQVDAPRYHKGFWTASGFSVAAVVLVFVVKYLHERDLRR